MALNTYSALQTSIADWLNRSDLTAVIPDFINVAEVVMKRKIRKWTTLNSAFSITGAVVAAPADLLVPRSIRLLSGSPEQDNPLRVVTIEMLGERNARSAGVAGRPSDVAYVDGNFYFAPTPDQTYTAELWYFSTLIPLSGSVASNQVLVEAPDAYLWGSLMQAEPYLEHDDRIPIWKAKFDEAIDDLNALRDEQEYNMAPKDMRLPRVLG